MTKFDKLIKNALSEDIGQGDVTTAVFVPAGISFEGRMFAKSDGVLAGAEIAKRVFELADPGCRVSLKLKDGARFKKGDTILKVSGTKRMLTAERTALNFIQHLSGVATKTASYAARLGKSRTKIYDTRKTIPGLRMLEKMAVKAGGGANHRMGLYDAFLIKDNHLDFIGGSLERLKEKLALAGKKKIKIEIEAQSLKQVSDFTPLGLDIIMLDNMSVADMKKAIAHIRKNSKKTEIEISGGVKFEDLSVLAKLGADRISVGSITNSAPALDIAFERNVA